MYHMFKGTVILQILLDFCSPHPSITLETVQVIKVNQKSFFKYRLGPTKHYSSQMYNP